MHIVFEIIVNYFLVGAALFPVFMRLDRHTFKHVIETTDEMVTVFFCWVAVWPIIGFFVVRNKFALPRKKHPAADLLS